jgi:UDP-3-O-[3-hydroxymyristoyl] N-acetylglucosamine deacetylase
MRITPAAEKHGIIFKRLDISGKACVIELSANSVVEPTLCTRVVNKSGISVVVVEHLLAALRICGITNALIELDAPELPVMDGSAAVFVKEIRKAGITSRESFVPAIVITKPIVVESASGKISVIPGEDCDITVKLAYDRINRTIGENNSYTFTFDDDLSDIASSRTFGWLEDYEKVRQMGLARGSSDENTIAIMPDGSVRSKDGLRHKSELVMHKCLDLIGDMAVLGYDIVGNIEALNPSHMLNNVFVRKILRELRSHKIVREEQTTASSGCYYKELLAQR